MLFDTDILVWVERGDRGAVRLVDSAEERHLSIYSYLELLYGAGSQRKTLFQNYLRDTGFSVLPLTENIGHRSLMLMQEYSSRHGLGPGDAIIASTAIENGLTLVSGNRKHFTPLQGLKLKIYKPE